MTVEIGLFLLGAHGMRETVDYARAAEEAGLGAVWLAEHHFITYGRCPSATVLAGHLLAATSRIAVGTAACVLSTRHPVALGEEAAVLAELAPGRFRLGVARGGPWVDLEVFGTGLPRFERGFPEALDLLLAWLSGVPLVSGDGEFFRFREVAVVPRPGPVPVWVAATTDSTVDIAARRGLPLLLGVHVDEAAKAATLTRYAEVAAGAGHDPDSVPHASAHLIGPDRATLTELLGRTREYVRIDGSPPAQHDLESYVDRLMRTHKGGPAELAAIAGRLGVRHLLVMAEAAGDPPDLISRLGPRAARTPDPAAGTRNRPR